MSDIQEKIPGKTSSLVELLCYRAQYQPDKTGYIFLNDGESDETRLTYRELDRHARSVAVRLNSIGAAGERALLLYQPGLEYVSAFFGCLYAGVTAVPVYPPHPARLERTLPRLKNIAKDAGPFAVMTSSSVLPMAEPFLSKDPDFGNAKWLSTDDIPADEASGWQKSSLAGDSLAFLQYTSGSTGIPKGVMVSHENLLFNLDLIHTCFDNTPESVGVIWLPPYHDMGLIGGILQPIYGGFPVVLMSPVHFLQKPFRWLDAISKYKASVSGGPNFAYDLCVRKITPDQMQMIDLSSWEIAFNGAEPIRPNTMEQFSEAFRHCGFRREAFYPCYGLAEGTLIVSGGLKNEAPVLKNFSGDALAKKRALPSTGGADDVHTLVGCGKNLPGQQIAIVEPYTFSPCEPDEIGEIWVLGKSVAQGYWQNPEETKDAFQAYITDTGQGPFLRTGDLGFLSDDELFVTGRLKDMIIIRGRNYYPHDIEMTAEKSYPRLRPGCSAVFEVEINGEKRVVVTAEIERRQRDRRKKSPDKSGYKGKERRHRSGKRQHTELPYYDSLENKEPVDVEKAVKAIRRAISEEHELEVYAVLILKIGGIPKTSSGKIQRYACKKGFLNKTLDVVASSILEDEPEDIESKDFPGMEKLWNISREERQALLISYIQDILSTAFKSVLSGDKLDIHENFFDLGGDSLMLVRFNNKLQEILSRNIPITSLFKYPTIAGLAEYLAQINEENTFDFQKIRDRVGKQKDTVSSRDAIAVIGMAGRFPGAGNTDEFWRNLCSGIESISTFTDEELKSSGVDPALLNNPYYVKAGALLEDIEMFDSSFFGISPKEATLMDPHQRIFLECAWEAFENAGYEAGSYKDRTGVYAGSAMNTYLLKNLVTNQNFRETMNNEQTVICGDKDYVSTRVSYSLNLKGPSISLGTACSTSLVAVHLACRGLLNYECDMALAGGVSVTVPQKEGYLYQQGGMQSPDGHCRAFDAGANGTVFSSGVGIVVLKRLEEALKDGDFIYAVVKGSAVNNDGSAKAGYTAPSVTGQTEAIAEAQVFAGIAPETVTYIEAHGTGTTLGDPIEIQALTEAFRAGTQKKQFCAIGSVKTNVGHLNMTAGVAGFIKAALAVKNKIIPPNLNIEKPNPRIDFENSPFYVNTRLNKWETDGFPRRAGVSSLGIGGTNAHVILEQAPDQSPQPAMPEMASGMTPRTWQLLILSAKTETAINKAAINMAEHLNQHPDLNLSDVSYTLQVGRKAFSHRRIMVCRDVNEAAAALASIPNPNVPEGYCDSGERAVVFMFSGQGSQYMNMGLDLYQTEPVFRTQVDLCSGFLKPHLKFDLRHVLYPELFEIHEVKDLGLSQSPDFSISQFLEQTAVAQPALFVIEYALARLWMAWGINPCAMIGHSIGEYTAACLAGVFSLKDALSLVAARGRMMQEMPGGEMLAIPLPEKEVQAFLNSGPSGQNIFLAAVNAPSLCVVSGTKEAVESLKKNLSENNIECRLLHTSHAFHSGMTEPVLEPFAERVRKVNLNPPSVPFISNVSGDWITDAEAKDPLYWAGHLRQTVRFARGMKLLLEEPGQILLEVGPGTTLNTFAMRHPDKTPEHTVISSVRHPGDQQSDSAFLLTTLGKLWLAGVKVDWNEFHAYNCRYRVPLPTYPFERERHWIEPGRSPAFGIRESGKKPDIADWFYVPSWERTLFGDLEFEPQDAGCWLVFMDECGLGAQLAEQLKKYSQDIIEVKAGTAFAKQNDNDYTLNPGKQNEYDELFTEISNAGKIPKKVIHLWNVTKTSENLNSVYPDAQHLDLSVYSLIFLAQALWKQSSAEEIRIAVVSNNMQEVTGEEPLLCPEKATLLGPVKVIEQECPNIRCCSIDIMENISDRKITDCLLAELKDELYDKAIAYRGNYRWVQLFKPVRLESNNKPSRLREKGVYLITGGLGGIGLVLAEYLANTVQAKLILTGRSAVPPRNEWDEWLASHEDNDNTSLKIQKLKQIEELGSEILVAKTDVADEEQMKAAVDQALNRFGRINGVIHAAGIVGGGMIHLKTRENMEKTLLPKVKGTLVLDSILKGCQPDFFILCSSISSVLGGFGRADYAGANAFLDAFVYQKKAEDNIFRVSINWDNWQEVGMAVNAVIPLEKLRKKMQESLQKEGISPLEGTEAVSRILKTALPQVIVSPLEFEARAEKINFRHEQFEEDCQLPKTAHARLDLSSPYVPPRNEAEEIIAEIFQQLIGKEKIGVYDNFFELGGHSLMATQVVSRLRDAFHIEMPLEILFRGPTVAELSENVEKISKSSNTVSSADTDDREEGEI
ncbi:MAG: SDR family NAD(P)-dependent oxidoreductase [Desulfobacterales bacterium]|nr:SDR family NAD(P)-dependent oxidoreductase [Desulfobacterales bacterium]